MSGFEARRHWKGTFHIILLASSWWACICWVVGGGGHGDVGGGGGGWCSRGDLMWELLNSLLISLGRRVLHLRLIHSFWSHAWLAPINLRPEDELMIFSINVWGNCCIVSWHDNSDIDISLSCVMWSGVVWWCTGIIYQGQLLSLTWCNAGLQFFLLIIAEGRTGPSRGCQGSAGPVWGPVCGPPRPPHTGLDWLAGDNRLNFQSEWGKYPDAPQLWLHSGWAVWFIWNDDSNANFKMWGNIKMYGREPRLGSPATFVPPIKTQSPLLSLLSTVSNCK